MTDAHCHLQDIPNFDISNLRFVICSGASIESSRQAIAIAAKHHNVYATVGVHPESKDELSIMYHVLRGLAKENKVVAIGECGLDSDNPREIELLKFHVDWAKETNLPLIIHNRNQDQKILETLGDYSKVMLHCFTSDEKFMKESVNRGWYISLGGILTFKNSGDLREVAKLVPDDKLLIETDSPYLSPEPFRGKPNSPKNVKMVAQMLANLRNTSIDQIEEITDNNIQKLFGLPHPA